MLLFVVEFRIHLVLSMLPEICNKESDEKVLRVRARADRLTSSVALADALGVLLRASGLGLQIFKSLPHNVLMGTGLECIC